MSTHQWTDEELRRLFSWLREPPARWRDRARYTGRWQPRLAVRMWRRLRHPRAS